jgi:hypothetical protein
MDNLVFSCTDPLLRAATPACTTDYGERIVSFAVMKEGGTFTVAGSDNPTAAEFQTAITSGSLLFFTGLSNGHKLEAGATELSGDDTITGGSERWDVTNKFEAKIKLIDETIKRATERLDRFSRLRLWIFTDKGYVYGGKTGYYASPVFSTVIHEGKGQPPYINVAFEWNVIGLDNAKYDSGYTTLTA